MQDLVIIDKDIKRCYGLLKNNDYLEMVICIEEIRDSYSFLFEEDVNNQRVWNYTKKDLECLLVGLREYRFTIIKKDLINDLIGLDLDSNKLEEVTHYFDDITNIYLSNDDKNKKWDRLKQYVSFTLESDVNIAKSLIYLTNVVLQDN